VNRIASQEQSAAATPDRGGGPLFVALGAFLWATDAVFRAHVVTRYSAALIVFLNHALALVVALPLIWRSWRTRRLAAWSRREWAALLVLALGGSVIAGLLFTEAFARTANYTAPMLIQKLQPLVAIGLARILLGERLVRRFWLWAVVALAGAYLVSFGFTGPAANFSGARWLPSALALGAAAIWGSCTIAGRILLARRSYWLVTAVRFCVASVFLGALLWHRGEGDALVAAVTTDFTSFAMMAYVPGLLALLIYYYGLKTTPAAVATLCELAFPVGAIAVNWWILDAPLSAAQLLGAGMLTAAVTALSFESVRG
jgi:drug/metabolite transporter (DMT)-like permease